MTASTEVMLTCRSGIIQYASTVGELLHSYGKSYELRKIAEKSILWHKGHREIVGEIKMIPARG